MTIQIENESSHLFSFDMDKLITSVILETLDYLDCPYEAECSVLITGDTELRVLNDTFRHIDSATDVLSFPMIPFTRPCDYELLETNVESYFSPETGELLLGDIVISYDKVIGQAEKYGHSIERELAFLVIHSVLHLLGYDHMEETERIRMEKQQEEILEILGISR